MSAAVTPLCDKVGGRAQGGQSKRGDVELGLPQVEQTKSVVEMPTKKRIVKQRCVRSAL